MIELHAALFMLNVQLALAEIRESLAPWLLSAMRGALWRSALPL